MNTYIVVWSGGYELPSVFATTDEEQARTTFERYAKNVDLDAGDSVVLAKFDANKGSTIELDVI